MSLARIRWALAAGVLAFVCSTSDAQYWSPALQRPLAHNPDMRGPGFYMITPTGYVTGPHYVVVPPWCPESGVGAPGRPCRKGGGPMPGGGHPGMAGSPGLPTTNSFPSHPYARSPRDFFMFHENLEAERSRDFRPSIVP